MIVSSKTNETSNGHAMETLCEIKGNGEGMMMVDKDVRGPTPKILASDLFGVKLRIQVKSISQRSIINQQKVPKV